MSWTLCLSGNAILKAGINANADIISGVTDIETLSTEAEGFIAAQMHIDVVTNFSKLPTQIQNAVSDWCSSRIAMSIVSIDPTGMLTREADMLMNMNDDIITKSQTKLKQKEFHRFST